MSNCANFMIGYFIDFVLNSLYIKANFVNLFGLPEA